MGTPVESIVIGANCSDWILPAETPKFMYVMFFDVLKGDVPVAKEPPNLHVFKMVQNPAQACAWLYENFDFNWRAELITSAAQSSLTLGEAIIPSFVYFNDITGPSPVFEYAVYDNIFTGPIGTFGYLGHGTVFSLLGALELAVSFGLDLPGDLNLDQTNADTDKFVIKLVSLALKTNVLIKFAP